MESNPVLRVEDLARGRKRTERIIYTIIFLHWSVGMCWSHLCSTDRVDYQICVSTVSTLAVGAAALVRMYVQNYDYLDTWMKPDETEERESRYVDAPDTIGILPPLSELDQDHSQLPNSIGTHFRSSTRQPIH